jgi:hypothetical protein
VSWLAAPTVLDARDLATRWEGLLELSAYDAAAFVAYWVETGVFEPAGANGDVRVSEWGRELLRALVGAQA